MSGYVIVMTRDFFAPQKKQRTLVLDEHTGTVARFCDLAAARMAVRCYDNRVYRLSHNESSRPDYTVRGNESLPAYPRREAEAA